MIKCNSVLISGVQGGGVQGGGGGGGDVDCSQLQAARSPVTGTGD